MKTHEKRVYDQIKLHQKTQNKKSSLQSYIIVPILVDFFFLQIQRFIV